MAKTSVDIHQLKFNKMSSAKYEELKLAGQLVDNEFYITPDGGTIPEVNETTNDFVLSNNGTDLNWIQETEYTKNRIDSKLNDNVRTNCITKIPQDIKLELVDGILTLKAGSKIYKGDGSFIITEQDVQLGQAGTNTNAFAHYVFSSQEFVSITNDGQFSGDTAPENPLNGYIWYDTINKQNKFYYNDAWIETSFPICIFSNVDGQVTSIDQVFNGFGYIGSTIFALPGVEGLIPNGRNEDGSLNNTKFTITSVLTTTVESDVYNGIVLSPLDNTIIPTENIYYFEQSNKPNEVIGWWYNTSENKCYRVSEGNWELTEFPYIKPITYIAVSGKITSFSPKNVFQAVDRNDTNWASTASKPSNRYIDLNLEASGTKYIMPANGRLFLNKQGNTNEYCHMFRTNKNPQNGLALGASPTGAYTASYVVQKGDEIQIDYNLSGTTFAFNFIYDEGEI